jgi:hypothetical protein
MKPLLPAASKSADTLYPLSGRCAAKYQFAILTFLVADFSVNKAAVRESVRECATTCIRHFLIDPI